MDILELFSTNKQAFKQYDILKIIKKNDNLESLYDELSSVVKNYQTQQAVKQLFSQKYRKLINEQSLFLLQELMTSNHNKKQIQTSVMNKIARFNTADEFAQFLQKYISGLNLWSMNIYIDKAQQNNATYYKIDENTLIIQTTTFEQMANLGSPYWCIAQQDSFFRMYVKDMHSQYIYLDFNKKSSNPTSMIGYTYNDITMQPYCAFNKLDRVANKKIPNSMLKIILKDKMFDDIPNLSFVDIV
jgi:hypothetical protein